MNLVAKIIVKLNFVAEFKAHTTSPSKLNAGSPSIMKKRGYEQANGVDGMHGIWHSIYIMIIQWLSCA